jgi:hypothetical protein
MTMPLLQSFGTWMLMNNWIFKIKFCWQPWHSRGHSAFLEVCTDFLRSFYTSSPKMRSVPGTTRKKWLFYRSFTWFLYQSDIFAECPSYVLSLRHNCLSILFDYNGRIYWRNKKAVERHCRNERKWRPPAKSCGSSNLMMCFRASKRNSMHQSSFWHQIEYRGTEKQRNC